MAAQHAIRIEDVHPFRFDEHKDEVFNVISEYFSESDVAGVSPQYQERYHYILFHNYSDKIINAARELNRQIISLFKLTTQPFKYAHVTFISAGELSSIHFKKPLRVNLDFNVEEFIEFLQHKTTNPQQRERFNTESSYISDFDKRRATIIAENIFLEKNKIRVYINGQLSTDFTCFIKEKADVYIIILHYKHIPGHIEVIRVPKEEEIEPIYKSSAKPTPTLSVEGRNLAITIEGFDAWMSQRNQHKNEASESTKPTVIYTSQPTEERKHAASRMASVSQTDEEVSVTITDEQTEQATHPPKEQTTTESNKCIFIKDIDRKGHNVLIYDTGLDESDVRKMLMCDGKSYSEILQLDCFPFPLPQNTTLFYYTPMGEEEIRRKINKVYDNMMGFFNM